MQRPWDINLLGAVEEQAGGKCDSNRRRKRERERGRCQRVAGCGVTQGRLIVRPLTFVLSEKEATLEFSAEKSVIDKICPIDKIL